MADVTQNDIISEILDVQHRTLVLLSNAIDSDTEDKAQIKKDQQQIVDDHTQILSLTQQVSDLTAQQKQDLSDKLKPILDAANEALHKAQSATPSEDPVTPTPLPQPTTPVDSSTPSNPTASVPDSTGTTQAGGSTVPGVVQGQPQQPDNSGVVISPITTGAANPFEPSSTGSSGSGASAQ